jgi:hypothetical protein
LYGKGKKDNFVILVFFRILLKKLKMKIWKTHHHPAHTSHVKELVAGINQHR